jgi:hypothetical protein
MEKDYLIFKRASASRSSGEWTNVKILERVRELQERGAARAEVTVESLIREAEEVRKEALAARQFSAAM